jgi:hypothetical protein
MAHLLELEHLPIRLTARGEWLHGTVPLHPRVAELFARHVVPEPDGNYRIELGKARHPLDVEDTAYAVRRLDLRGDANNLENVWLWLSDATDGPLDPSTLMQSADNVLYCRIIRNNLAVPVRFTPQQYHTLGLHVTHRDGHYALAMGGRYWPIAPYSIGPAPVPGAHAGRRV